MLTMSYFAVITVITTGWIAAIGWAMRASKDPARTGRTLGIVGMLLGLACGISGAVVGWLA